MTIPFKIFPGTITPDKQKIPLASNWQNLASNDPAQIKIWMEQYKEKISYWLIPTGKINDLLVLDIDIKNDGWKSIQEKHLEIPNTMSQKTLNGGSHFFFHYPNDGKQYGNKVGLLPGIDVRGEGGYIFFYGAQQRPILDAPKWLLDGAVKTQTVTPQGPVVKISPEISQGIIESSIEAIREAPQGESNNVLNVESFKIGQLIASGSISREYAENILLKAALERGKPIYESKATIASGLDGGFKKPLISPFGTEQPSINIQIPKPPEPPGRWTPSILTREDLLNSSKLRKPQLFQDWSTEDIHITTADGGTGKTTLKLYEAVCLALGERFLGFDNKQKGKTLFITGEDTDKKLGAMIGAIVRQMGLFEDAPGNNEKIQTILDSILIKKDADLCIIQKDRNGFLHLNSDSLRKVLEAIHDFQPKMVVFDPISSFWGSEAALNDMNKAVIKFMNEIIEKCDNGVCVEMINHMGKQSSANKDMTQFAGRGGSGLPSNARVSRVLRPVFEDEYMELTGESLGEKESAMMCNVNKFTDGSPLYNKPFVILRNGYLFSKKTLTPQKAKDAEKAFSDIERVFSYIKTERNKNRYPTTQVVVGNFMLGADPLSEARTKRALIQLQYTGHMGEKIKIIENPDLSIKDKAFVIINEDGLET